MSILTGRTDPEPVSVKGVALRCEICKNSTFWHRRAQLQNQFASLFNLDWTGKPADCFICANCGYVHWFVEV